MDYNLLAYMRFISVVSLVYSMVHSVEVSVPSSELGPPPLPLLPPHARESVSPFGPKRGGRQNSLAGEGMGGYSSDDWMESLELCILCGSPPPPTSSALSYI